MQIKPVPPLRPCRGPLCNDKVTNKFQARRRAGSRAGGWISLCIHCSDHNRVTDQYTGKISEPGRKKPKDWLANSRVRTHSSL